MNVGCKMIIKGLAFCLFNFFFQTSVRGKDILRGVRIVVILASSAATVLRTCLFNFASFLSCCLSLTRRKPEAHGSRQGRVSQRIRCGLRIPKRPQDYRRNPSHWVQKIKWSDFLFLDYWELDTFQVSLLVFCFGSSFSQETINLARSVVVEYLVCLFRLFWFEYWNVRSCILGSCWGYSVLWVADGGSL